jgi:DNA-binding winged helix-turn-helix (wHTH) protein
MDSKDDSGLRFGDFLLDFDRGHLRCRGEEVVLRPKAWAVLCHLAARQGQVVSVDELLDACWRDLHVGPHAVSNVIYVLRTALVAGGGEADWIQSIARRGYRFHAPV